MAPHIQETMPIQQNGYSHNINHNPEPRNEPKDGDYIQWQALPPGGPLNRWSQKLTRGHDSPGAQVSEIFPSLISLSRHLAGAQSSRRKKKSPSQFPIPDSTRLAVKKSTTT
ncbi:hypothetical protein V8F06_011787 [Rhypophila decipiens]